VKSVCPADKHSSAFPPSSFLLKKENPKKRKNRKTVKKKIARKNKNKKTINKKVYGKGKKEE
jgi:hypothetical protein